MSLADAGDRMDDANFDESAGRAAIYRLGKERKWVEDFLAADELTFRRGPVCGYADRVFANEINFAIKMTEKNYDECKFREALQTGFYSLQAARDEYRLSCGSGGMNRDLLWRLIDVARIILSMCGESC